MQRDLNRRIRIIHPSVMFLLVSFVLLSSFSGANAQPLGPEQYGLSSGFDPSMAIVVVVVVAAFFFIGMFSIFLRQCSEPAASGYYSSYAGAARYLRSRLSHGLDKSVIESFPVLDCSAIKEAKIGEGLECAVCLGEFEDDQSFRLLPKCRHVFHPDCIDTWLTSHVTCPVCRANLEEQDSSPSPSTGGRREPPEPRADEITIPVGDFERLRPVRITGGKFPRSHSTGHSLAVINEDREAAGVDRYTLRLPVELMTEVIDRSRLERAASFNAAGAYVSREWSSTKGYKGNSTEEEGTDQGGRWVVFSMTPPFVSRGPVAVKLSTHKDVDGNGDGGSSVNSTNLLVSVKVPLNFLGGKVEGTGEPSAITARPLV